MTHSLVVSMIYDVGLDVINVFSYDHVTPIRVMFLAMIMSPLSGCCTRSAHAEKHFCIFPLQADDPFYSANPVVTGDDVIAGSYVFADGNADVFSPF